VSTQQKPDPTGTVIDPSRANARLKEGLVPDDTGIFLRVEEGTDAGRVFNLSSGGVYTIGREGTDIPLDDPKVSRKHAEIGLYGPGAWVLRDLASTNGTRVNERRVDDRRKLAHWDAIRVGDTLLRLALVENAISPSS
jgi:pSer/pThr/pTyr-binding forkhead associated (FHA) protein